jgi:outer membrane protein assembly factor BamB
MIALTRIFGLLLVISSAAAAQQLAPQADATCGVAHSTTVNWSQFHFDPCHTGYNPYETILSPANVGNLVLAWNVQQPGEAVYTSPAVINGVVYFGSSSGDGLVYAVNAATGDRKWTKDCGGFSNEAGSPAVAYGRVYVACRSAVLALDASTGQVLWETTDPFFDHPFPEITAANGALYVASYHEGNTRRESVYALDADTGAVLWKLTGNWDVTTPAIADGMVFVGCYFASLCAIDPVTGVLVWQYTADGTISPAAVAGGVVYFGSLSRISFNNNDTHVYALDATTGALLWRRSVITTPNAAQDDVLSTPAIANGIVYIGSGYYTPNGGRLYAVDASTGTLLWKYDAAGLLNYSSPAVANGVVYFGSTNSDRFGSTGDIYALDEETGDLLWKYHAEEQIVSSPAVVNGRLYVGSVSYMYAFHLPEH